MRLLILIAAFYSVSALANGIAQPGSFPQKPKAKKTVQKRKFPKRLTRKEQEQQRIEEVAKLKERNQRIKAAQQAQMNQMKENFDKSMAQAQDTLSKNDTLLRANAKALSSASDYRFNNSKPVPAQAGQAQPKQAQVPQEEPIPAKQPSARAQTPR